MNMLLLSALLCLAFGGVLGDNTTVKATVLGCEFTTYPNTFYQTDYYQSEPGFATTFASFDECLSYCLLDPACKSLNAKNATCTFHTSSIQGDVKESIKAGKAGTNRGWTHYKIEQCPEETSSTPVGCGVQASSFMPSFTRIIGGKEAKPNSWPWQAYLQATSDDGKTFICGSSLLRVKDNVESSDILLTAGHCVSFMIPNTTTHAFYKPEQLKAVFGTHNRAVYQAGVQVRLGDRIVAHPDFNLSRIHNDVALIRLSKPVKFSNKIRPICLPSQGEALPAGKLCAVAGWGRTNSSSQATSPVLKELSMPVHNATVCANGWGSKYIENQMVCGGNLNGDSGTCSGDSGGMLACKDNGKWILQGATSFGVADVCIQANRPKVFARISTYVDWVKTTMAGMTTL